jgi:hypothetical protein
MQSQLEGQGMSKFTRDNKPDSGDRRKTLKTLAVGVGALAGSTVMPDKWITPVIKGFVLPAHAQTSAPLTSFCSDPAQLTLVDGHSGTDEMTIEASGCITPAQTNVELELSLSGYATAVITRNEEEAANETAPFLATVSEALVSSAHAAEAPVCTVKVKVKTGGDGYFNATVKLKCGKGIVQVVLDGKLNGIRYRNIGWLDIHACNPCASPTTTEDTGGASCRPLTDGFVQVTNETSVNAYWGPDTIPTGGRIVRPAAYGYISSFPQFTAINKNVCEPNHNSYPAISVITRIVIQDEESRIPSFNHWILKDL